jgi:D-aminopeptidase
VKKSLTCQGAHLFSKKKTRKLIEEKTVEAIGKLSLMKTPQIKKPVKLRKEYVERYSPPIKSEFNVIDGRTVEITSDSLEKALFMMI